MNQNIKSTEGVVFNIQRYSIHDGPGIRTIPFLKGCPLSCKWCSNPESQRAEPEILFNKAECVACGKCLHVCQYGAIDKSNPYLIDRSKCVSCGDCAKACPTDALVQKGKRITVWEVMQELQKDAITYRRSNGGITLSGGEPLSQPEFARDLLKSCKEKGWHTAMETSCMATQRAIEEVMPFVDLALIDIKVIDPQVHEEVTGVRNRLILENAIRASQITQAVVRVPVVPGVNNTVEAITAIGEFVRLMNGVTKIHLLPYHTFGENKYHLLGRCYPMGETSDLTDDNIQTLKLTLESMGYNCEIGG